MSVTTIHPIERIRDAFERAHAICVGSRAHYMSIPPDPERDADLILTDAIEELAALRARVTALEQPRCCSVCAGHGDPTSGRECVCGGFGTETAEILGLRATAIEMAARVAELERDAELLRETASMEARLACAWARKLPDDHWMIRDGIVIGLRSLIALGPRPEGEAQDAR